MRSLSLRVLQVSRLSRFTQVGAVRFASGSLEPTIEQEGEPTHNATPEADILSVSESTEEVSQDTLGNAVMDDKRIPPGHIRVLHPKSPEAQDFEVRKMVGEYAQDGAFLGSRVKDKQVATVDRRKRRQIFRVPKMQLEYKCNETSFRRLPRDFILPNEQELRTMYPAKTRLVVNKGYAQFADMNAVNPDEAPDPMLFSALYPPNYDPKKEYPTMVFISDGGGLPRDFSDACFHLFERKPYLSQVQEWVILSPTVNVKRHASVDMSVVIARFCEWVRDNFRCESNGVHVVGKGWGAHAGAKAILETSNFALSFIGLFGRPGSPIDIQEKPATKIHNVNGTHTLFIVPGLERNTEWIYKYKLFADSFKVRPPVRVIHYAGVQDHQVYYAVNPVEFWNYLSYFRKYNGKQISEAIYQDPDMDEFDSTAVPTPQKPPSTHTVKSQEGQKEGQVSAKVEN